MTMHRNSRLEVAASFLFHDGTAAISPHNSHSALRMRPLTSTRRCLASAEISALRPRRMMPTERTAAFLTLFDHNPPGSDVWEAAFA